MAQLDLDTCGCCGGAHGREGPCPFGPGPPRPDFPPGLPSLSGRRVTHTTAFGRMLACLPTVELIDEHDPGPRPLAALTTRSVDDFAVGFLDAVALVTDVLDFYRDRSRNEGFWRTAREQRSVLELARTIGYELNPGVAASATLAFTVEDAPGAPGRAHIEVGTKVMSVPGQNERPQIFETVESLDARAELNVLRAAATQAQQIAPGLTQLYLEGVATRLQRGDVLAIVSAEREQDPASEHWSVRVVDAVEPDTSAGHTRVSWLTPLGAEWTDGDAASVHALRRRASAWGHNAVDWKALTPEQQAKYGTQGATDWENRSIFPGTVFLDAEYPGVRPGSWGALSASDPDDFELFRVVSATRFPGEYYMLAGTITQLDLEDEPLSASVNPRTVAVFVESEPLALARSPLADPVKGAVVELEQQLAEPLERGRRLVFRQPELVKDGVVAEPARIEAAVVDAYDDDGAATITLEHELVNAYDRARLEILANIAPATHGETVADEVLGGGDGSRAQQRFALKRPPLTYISAPTPSGGRNTLELRVDGVRWEEAPTLYGLEASARRYAVRIEDGGTATVVFGSGGARLPSGQGNVRASYRTGIGLEGMVGANVLTLLQTPPLGVRAVTNPLPAEGGGDPERLEDARANAPLTVRTLERPVSRRDFEDFTRSFAGLVKASAITLWDGESRVVHITVAAENGKPLPPQSDTQRNLLAALERFRDPAQRVLVADYQPRSFGLAAKVLVAAERLPKDVEAAIREALLERFGFARRELGQGVTSAEVIATIQGVAGVEMVDLDLLVRIGVPAAPVQPASVIPATLAHWTGDSVAPAELLTIERRHIRLAVIDA
jgi:predicted phage baseplate assembly protein